MSFAARRLSKHSSRVRRGAALLDAKLPGWESSVDLDRLEIRDPARCVLGQLWGSFGKGLNAVGMRDICGFAFPFTHGFMASPWSLVTLRYAGDSQTLTLLWAAEVIARRRKAQRGAEGRSVFGPCPSLISPPGAARAEILV